MMAITRCYCMADPCSMPSANESSARTAASVVIARAPPRSLLCGRPSDRLAAQTCQQYLGGTHPISQGISASGSPCAELRTDADQKRTARAARDQRRASRRQCVGGSGFACGGKSNQIQHAGLSPHGASDIGLKFARPCRRSERRLLCMIRRPEQIERPHNNARYTFVT